MPRGVYERTPEHGAAISRATRGENNPMYGKHHSEEALKKISDGVSAAKTGVAFTPAHCAAMSRVRKDVLLPLEHCVAIAKGLEEAGVHDEQRGGNDICKHHYIYDHNNPTQHTVDITRSEHASHHWWMKRNGLKVPHYNITEDNKDIFKRRIKYV